MPFGPRTGKNSTFWPSARVLKPSPWISLKWAKRSSPPADGVMKPKPLASLNHLTVPVCLSDIVAFPLNDGLRAPKTGRTLCSVQGKVLEFWIRGEAGGETASSFFDLCSGRHTTRVCPKCRVLRAFRPEMGQGDYAHTPFIGTAF